MDHPKGVEPPIQNVARCYVHSSDADDLDEQRAPILEADDRAAGKRPVSIGPSKKRGGAPHQTSGSATVVEPSVENPVPKCRRLLQLIEDEEDKDSDTPNLVPRSRSEDVVPSGPAPPKMPPTMTMTMTRVVQQTVLEQ